jgi:hypothetical protein
LFEPLVERHQNLACLSLSVGLAVDRQLIPTAKDLHAKPGFDFGEVSVVFTAKIDE